MSHALWGDSIYSMVTDSLVSSLILICRTLITESIDIINEKINPSERNLWLEKWQTPSALVSRNHTQVALSGSFLKYFVPQFFLMHVSSCIRIELVHRQGITMSHDHQSSGLWWENLAIFSSLNSYSKDVSNHSVLRLSTFVNFSINFFLLPRFLQLALFMDVVKKMCLNDNYW